MTVQTTNRRVSYVGDGVTLSFPVPFAFLAASDLQVTGGGGYSVSGAGNPAGGAVLFTTAPTAGSRVEILRKMQRTQDTSYVPNDPFPAKAHETALDKLTMIAQEDADELLGHEVLFSRVVRAAHAIPPLQEDRAGMFLSFDAAGNPIMAGGLGADPALRSDLAAGNGASLIGVKPGLSAAQVFDNLHDIRGFGARGGGENDSAAFREALESGRRILIPNGEWLADIDFSNLQGSRLSGESRDKTIIKNWTTTGPGQAMRFDNASAPCQNHLIEHLTLRKRGASAEIDGVFFGASGGEIHQQEFITFRDMQIRGFRHNINVTGRLIWTQFAEVHSFQSTECSLRVVSPYNVSHLGFSSCRLGNAGTYGVYAEKNAGDTFGSWNFWDTNIELCQLNAFRLFGTVGISGLTIIGGYFEENAVGIPEGNVDPRRAVINIHPAVAHGVIIDGNTFYGSGGSPQDWHIHLAPDDGSGRIGPNRVGAANLGAVAILGGNFFVEAQGGGVGTLELNAGSRALVNLVEDEPQTFVASLTGCTTTPTGTIRAVKQGRQVTLYIPAITGTSNSTAATLTGMPEALRPVRDQSLVGRVQDATAGVGIGLLQVLTTGVIALDVGAGGGPFASTGTKGLPTQTVTYSVD